jgi:hypothetical protein
MLGGMGVHIPAAIQVSCRRERGDAKQPETRGSRIAKQLETRMTGTSQAEMAMQTNEPTGSVYESEKA